jgi:hypothetical protein
MFKCFLGHNYWVSVEAFCKPEQRSCRGCQGRKCAHYFKVCLRCGKAEGWGSHGKLTVIPDSCKAQIREMRMGVNYKGKPDELS